jgi:hypothetical protein
MIARVALVAIALAAGPAAAQDNPLTRAIPAVDGSSACFSRSYDAAHLKQHPRQMTQAVLLSLRFDEGAGYHIIRVMLREKNRPAPLHGQSKTGVNALYVVGVCGWSDKANLGVDDKPLIKEFKATSGLDCHAYAGLNTDEEGGDFPIDLAADGKSLTLYLFDQISAWLGTNQRKGTIGAKLGKEDLIFRLERVDAAACRGIERALRGKE